MAEQEEGGQKEEFVSWTGHEDPKAVREPRATGGGRPPSLSVAFAGTGRSSFGSSFLRCTRFLMSAEPEAS